MCSIRATFLTLLTLMAFVGFGQSSPNLDEIDFKLGKRSLDRSITSEDKSTLSDASCTDGLCLRWVQFDEILTEEQQLDMMTSGWQIIEYVRHHCYLIRIPRGTMMSSLLDYGARAIEVPDARTKMDPRIYLDHIPEYALMNGLVQVKVMLLPDTDRKGIQGDLEAHGAIDVTLPHHERFVFLKASMESLNSIVAMPQVRYVDIMDPAGEPESVEGRSIQRANLLDNHLSGTDSLSFDGDGVKILVRDDGAVGPHIDYQGRLINVNGIGAGGTHGDGVAGVWAAAGNLDPTVVAAAPGADVYVINYLSTFLDNTLSLHTDSGVVITNSSYSNGCNAGYTSTTVTVDEMAHDHPSLLHMFSAGNSNNNDCGYGAGNQWGNITGGHKQGKNVVAVANLFRDGALVGSSSRGPAHDGRIKPDLAGHGQGQISTDPNNGYSAFGGTSAAAPSVAGNMTQLYHAYREMNGGADPDAALIKACAMNSAQDLGQPGPDFKFGWGLIHGGRAYDILEQGQYLSNSVTTGVTVGHNITVPSGVAELRIMLYWNDPEASASASVALVNDLDLDVLTPSSTVSLPRVLDHTPNATTLDLPATSANAPDRLNNVEQVAITNPTAGVYQARITGHAVPQGPQAYYIVYTFIRDEIELTYPLGGERIVPGVVERIHWDAYDDNAGTFTVEYSTDGGSNWNIIASGVAGSERGLDWTPPSVTSGDCLVRVRRGSQSGQSMESFSIHPVPTGINISAQSLSDAIISVDSIPGATSYEVYILGDKYMEVQATSSLPDILLPGLSVGQQYWISVSATTGTAIGQRGDAVSYVHNPASSCGGCLVLMNLPLEAHFSEGLDQHCNGTGDDFDWTQNVGGTPSNSTGPSEGYTGEGYVYTEATGDNNPNKLALLGSQCVDLTNCTNAFMQFSYHMYGSGMGTLSIEVSTDGGTTWSAPIWSLSGNQGDQWLHDDIDLSGYCGGSFAYRFLGLTGTGFSSDMAVDNIRIDEGAICDWPLSITVGVITDSSADITVNLPAGVTVYDLLLLDESSGQLFDGMATHTGLSGSTNTIIGLQGSTQYRVYARSECSLGSSAWYRGPSFETDCNLSGNVQADAIIIPNVVVWTDTNNTADPCFDNQYSGTVAPDVFYQITTGSNTDSLFITTCHSLTQYDTWLNLLADDGSLLDQNDDMNAACSFPQASEIRYGVQPSTTYYIVVEGWSASAGQYRLRVEQAMDCPATLSVSGTPASGTYTAGDINSDALIQSPNSVIFSASGEIDLLPDFEVEQGAQFETDDAGCP